jgi:hypothetical protein
VYRQPRYKTPMSGYKTDRQKAVEVGKNK